MNSLSEKPGINLKIESKNSNFLNDQTPTPTTRLIKNCEEVGLFDDLKHVNPFDETFRRAVEESTVLINNKSTNNNLNLPSSEDTLHTPHIIYNDNCESKHTVNKDFEVNKDQSASLKTSSKSRVSDISKNIIKNCAKISLRNSRKITNKKLRMLLPNPKQISIKTIQPQIISLNFHGQIANTIKSSSKPVIEKSNIHESNYQSSCLLKKKLKSVIRHKKSVDKMETNENQNKNNSAYRNAKERKRAASMRYRSKKNNEICELRKRTSELLSENLFLKEQIKQLQHIIFTQHSNCSVARKQLENNPNGNLSESLKTPLIHIPPSTLVLNIPKIIIQQKAEFLDTVSKH